ncbi:hypothetical protein ES702_05974 [subsurface metagenome]
MSEKKVSLILGKRGSGKSYLVKKILQKNKHFVVFDTLGEYTDGVTFQELPKLLEFWEKFIDKNFRLIYQPLRPKEEFEDICRLVWACGDLTFVVEEIDTFCGSFDLPEHFAHIIQRGRHKDITLIGISQRPYGINRLLSSQAKEMCIFNTTEPRDLDYLKNYIEQGGVEQLKNLKEYQYLKWKDDGSTSILKA